MLTHNRHEIDTVDLAAVDSGELLVRGRAAAAGAVGAVCLFVVAVVVGVGVGVAALVASLLGLLGIRVRHPQFLLLCVPYARAACAFLLLEQHGFGNLGELAAVLALRVHAGCCGCSAAGAMRRAAGMLLLLLAAVDMAVAQELDAEAAAARLRKGYGRMYKRFRLTRFASSLLRLVPQHSLRVGGDSGCCKVD